MKIQNIFCMAPSAILISAFFVLSLPAAERPYLEAALKAAKWLEKSAIRTPHGLAWPADPRDPITINNSLYAGTPGPVLFFLELHSTTGNQSFLRLARAGADDLLAKLPEEKGLGLYEGIAGIGFTLEETFKATKDRRYREGFLGCLRRIREGAVKAGRGVEWGKVTDIISGTAGIGLLLLYANEELQDKVWLDLAEQAGKRLIDLGRPENNGLKWAMDPEFPRLMPNFSHGTAGIAYFLAALHDAARKKEYIEAALDGGRYLMSIAKTEGDVCLIFHHEPDGKDLFYLGWCHGPVGTAQLFWRLFKATGDKKWLDRFKNSARGIMTSGIPEKETPGFWNNDGLCCGLAGAGDFFLNLYRITREKNYLDFCRRLTDKLMAKATVEDGCMKWIQAEHRTRPELLIAQTGLMQGAAGIGLYLVHLDALEQRKRPKINLPDSVFVGDLMLMK
jgi:lantibiotic modifying enzyme